MTARAPRTVAALLASGFGLTLLAFFFQRRDGDVGHLRELLGALIASLARGPVFDAAGWGASLGGLVVATSLVLAWFGVGDLVVRACAASPASGAESRALDLASRALVGAGTWSIAWFALGVAHLYRPTVAVAAMLGGVALGVRACLRSAPGAPEPVARFPRICLVLIALVQTLALVAALAPPTANDTLLYHLALPKAYVAAGGTVDTPYNIASFYPLGAEMHDVWALLLGGLVGPRTAEAAAGATLFAFAPLLALVTYGWARERGADPPWASLAALSVAAIPTAYDVAAGGYIDLALVAYTALAVRAVGRWWTTLDAGWLPAAALAIGFALAIKLTAAALGLALALAVLIRALRASRAARSTLPPGHEPARLVLAGLGALALGALLAAPWYVRNWVRTGNPVFPFFLSLFGGQAPGWDLERSRLYESMFAFYGNALTPLDYLLSPVRLALAAQPEEPVYYDGVLGVAFLFAVALVLWALATRRLEGELGLALLVSSVLYVFWLFSSQQLRYLMPATPALAVALAVTGRAAAGALGPGSGRAFWWVVLCVAAAGVPVVLSWFAFVDPLRVVLGGEPRNGYLERRLDYYRYYEVINRQLPPTARVWLIDMRRDTYHLERPYFSDFIFEDWTFRQWLQAARDTDELAARVRRAGITHILLRHELLLDYARSPIVDDRRPREENLAKLELMTTFFTRQTRLLRGDGKFWLLELAPPR
ncbi:MAG: hypothetical protein DMD96_14655 [Candidatus Rokuibacteriota bacterium]|nr:MAG: hypothetical protein DMD96_14655 [Candidatus Rokubacteria bacterium]